MSKKPQTHPHRSNLFMSRRVFSARRSTCVALCVTLFFFPLLAGCGARRVPDLERIFATARAREGKRPIIVIPGVLGSQLVNRVTGEVVWPSAFRSDRDGLSLPVSPDLAANRDELVATRIVDRARFARLTPQVYVYYGLLDTLRRYGGYREGDWNNPTQDGDRDTFYVFAYDWRRDNVESARELTRRVEELKQRLGRPDLRFNVVAHSMGGLVARYAAMYGDADLAPDGATPQPTWVGASFINKVFMFGTPNEGTAEAFATLLDGYSITSGVRRRIPLLNKLSREDIYTAPAVFQIMPHRESTRFLDEHLQPLEIDLYDAATWRRYGWSAIFDADYRARYEAGRTRGDDLPRHSRSAQELDEYLVAVLNRARRFQEALDATTATTSQPNPVALYAFGGDCEETLDAPVIVRDAQRDIWTTLINARAFRASDGRRVSRREAERAMYEPGDSSVTRRSLLGQTLAARDSITPLPALLPLAHVVFVCDIHSDIQNNLTLQDNALTLLLGEIMN